MAEKTFSALDVVLFSTPTVRDINVIETSRKLSKYREEEGYSSYWPLWGRMNELFKGNVSDTAICSWFKSKYRVEAMKVLRDNYGKTGRWYNVSSNRVTNVRGLRFKGCVKGVLYTDEYGPEAHLINPRKSQKLKNQDLGFLSRSIYEEYCISNPSDPRPVIFDTSEAKHGKGRNPVFYRNIDREMISVDEFESIFDKFFISAQLAGFQINYHRGDFTVDEFRLS